ncbi:hypothetical protein BDV38DRAFT_246942 [Aspergillus pseudotamarii]|uniref:Uncharacterized protein n=1 Tax=Aspergillus pseudotamarii TaxID=132259 RepID=A0A5N6SS57_ASPPS|nr:uncharacterized protein BDV38DRAFT_246942 [Aspergillus pseudotamarii]KAE8137516.1 hypothetical protein BDV38DRAFT_246942 [Aspergillus pseudotamarii]
MYLCLIVLPSRYRICLVANAIRLGQRSPFLWLRSISSYLLLTPGVHIRLAFFPIVAKKKKKKKLSDLSPSSILNQRSKFKWVQN